MVMITIMATMMIMDGVKCTGDLDRDDDYKDLKG